MYIPGKAGTTFSFARDQAGFAPGSIDISLKMRSYVRADRHVERRGLNERVLNAYVWAI